MSDQSLSAIPEPQSEAERLILELERRAVALQQEQEEEPLVSLLTFSLNNEWFALPLDKIKVISRLLEVTPVPGTSRYVLGVINHKSAIYPLIDIHELLSLEPQMPTRSSRFVIIQHGKYIFAMLVDAMAEVREVRERELEQQVRINKDMSNYISSELTVDGRLLGLLNLDAILGTVTDGAENSNVSLA
jgi:purine-binding chemotaxis protein CheW